MGQAIGEILPVAIGVALSPVPIIAVILMLVSARAQLNSLAFVAGWLIGLAAVGAVVMAVAGPADTADRGAPPTWANAVQLVLGILLLAVAVRQFRSRPHGDEEPAMPTWMGAVDAFGPVKATAAGAVLSGLNPKNTLLAVSAAATVAQADIGAGEQAVAYATFALIATVGVAAPVTIYLALGDRAKAILDGLQTWMARNDSVIMAMLCLVIGAKLVGQAISGFAA